MISITEKAAEKVHEIASAEDLGGQGLRLRVVGGGCAGFSYDLYFEDKPTDMDETFEDKGVKLFIDPLSSLGVDLDHLCLRDAEPNLLFLYYRCLDDRGSVGVEEVPHFDVLVVDHGAVSGEV